MLGFIVSCLNESELETNTQLKDEATLIEMTDIVSSEEYANLSNSEKNIVDLLNSSINGLKGISLHSKENLSNHYATINVSTKNNNSAFSSYILLTSKNNVEYQKGYTTRSAGSSCTACGIRTGIKCAKQIIGHIQDNDLSELDINIQVNEDGCYEISW